MSSAEERKRKRLDAWRKKQQEDAAAAAPAKVSISLGGGGGLAALASKKKKKKRNNAFAVTKPKNNKKASNPFFADDEGDSGAFDKEDDDDDDDGFGGGRSKAQLLSLDALAQPVVAPVPPIEEEGPPRKRSRGRWDKKAPAAEKAPQSHDDALDKFMEKLEAGALGNITTQRADEDGAEGLKINVSGSMIPRKSALLLQQKQQNPVSGGVITPEELQRLGAGGSSSSSSKHHSNNHSNHMEQDSMDVDEGPRYTHSDWDSESGKSEPETDDEEEEKARRAFIEALKSAPVAGEEDEDEGLTKKPELAAEVKTEKQRREQRMKQLEQEAEKARQSAQAAGAPELGRLYNDAEGGVMEEAERNLDNAMAAPDALTVLAELNKKKELKSVDHSKMDYIDFKKNLYVVPRVLASLSNDEVVNLRAKLKVRVRGHGAPCPVTSFTQCGVSEKILKMLEKQSITKPFPVQAQCIPCIMAGRDVIGIAKTGSGKTLAYLLPMLRHIMVQPPLEAHESGPIGLILAPARELAYQIHVVCKTFCKNLGLNNQPQSGNNK